MGLKSQSVHNSRVAQCNFNIKYNTSLISTNFDIIMLTKLPDIKNLQKMMIMLHKHNLHSGNTKADFQLKLEVSHMCTTMRTVEQQLMLRLCGNIFLVRTSQ